jgi:hypothetical protein
MPTLAEIGRFRFFFYSNEGTAAAHPRSARAEDREILAGIRSLGVLGPVFRFRTPGDRAYRLGESATVPGGMV